MDLKDLICMFHFLNLLQAFVNDCVFVCGYLWWHSERRGTDKLAKCWLCGLHVLACPSTWQALLEGSSTRSGG
jgi:hypothetical protein